MNKKMKHVITFILGICILVGISFGFDYYRVQEGKTPLFCLKTVNEDGGSIQEFVGMGYKVIRVNRLVGWTRGDVHYYKQTKVGTWFMKMSTLDEEFEEAKKKLDEQNDHFVPFEELPQDYDMEKAILDGCFVIAQDGSTYNPEEIDNFCFLVGEGQRISLRKAEYTSKGDVVLTDFLYLPEKKTFQIREDHTRDKSVPEKERGISELVEQYFSEDCEINLDIEEEKEKQAVYSIYRKESEEQLVKEREIFRYDLKKVKWYVEYRNFIGKIVKVDTENIVIEPEENEAICRIGNQFCIKRKKWDKSKYSVGSKVQVTYSNILYKENPQVLENAEITTLHETDFEIHFLEEEDREYDVESIVLQKEGYSQNMYTYGGTATILFDGEENDLVEMLRSKKITPEEIEAKMKQDEKEGRIKTETLEEDTIKLYYYPTCTIVRYLTVEKNRDIYIAKPNLKITELP